ncbi:MAG: phage Gp37/Gp68 family protein [Chloroflexota bacterium]
MSERTAIEWCDSTFNPWIGCTRVSPACDHCYAEAQMATRMGRVEWGAGKPRSRTSAAYWRQPVQWNARADTFRECGACGWRGDIIIRAEPVPMPCPRCGAVDHRPARRRVFCASLADVFDNEVEVSWLADLLSLIHRTPDLDWLLLSKRIGNWRARIYAAVDLFEHRMVVSGRGDNHGYAMARNWLAGEAPSNVWIGATVVNQAEADRDILKLLAVPAATRFLSIEPMLGPVRLNLATACDRNCNEYQYAECPGNPGGKCVMQRDLNWIICGGESGPHARPMHPDWVRSLRDQCQAASVPFLFKQWGEWRPPAGAEPFNTAYGNAGKPPALLVSPDGSVSCFYPRDDTAKRPQDSVHKPMIRIGKRAAGRLLDGREHSEWPA